MEAETEKNTDEVIATSNEGQKEREGTTTITNSTTSTAIGFSTKTTVSTEEDNDVQMKMSTDYLQVLQEKTESDEKEDITEATFTKEVAALAAADDDNDIGPDDIGTAVAASASSNNTAASNAVAASTTVATIGTTTANNDSNNIINDDQERKKEISHEELERNRHEADMVLGDKNDITTTTTPVNEETEQDEVGPKPSSQDIENITIEEENVEDQRQSNDVSRDVLQNNSSAPTTIATNTTTTTSQFNSVILDEEDDDDDNDDDEMEDTVTYISVYTGEEIEKPSSSSTTTNSKKRKQPSTHISKSNQEIEDGFFALRRGRTTSHCIYLRKHELDVQIKDFPQAEYEHFPTLKRAVEYIQNDPMYVIRDNHIKKRRVYEIVNINENDGVSKKNFDTSLDNDEIPSTEKKAKTTTTYNNDKDDEEESWEGMYVQLLHFHRDHGNTDVPQLKKHKSLSEWVKKQRKDFIAFANGMDSTMTEAKVQLLLGLNFNFSAKTSNRTFDDYCQELVNYRARNEGNDPINGTNLNNWIVRIKKKYELYTKSNDGTVDRSIQNVHSDKDSTVTPTTVHGMDASKCLALEMIGFSWTKEPSEESKKKGKKFTPIIQQVPVKMTDMGNSSYAVAASSTGATAMAYASATAATISIANVDQTQHTPISPVTTVNNRVSVYTPISTKPKATTTPASYKSVKESKWNKAYTNLKKFKERNQNLDVEGDSDLGKWCLAQRKLYKKHKSGIKTFLNEEKIGQLKDLGFDFEPMSFLTKHQRNFYTRLEELKKYKEENGHCEVPTKSGLYAYFLDQKGVVSSIFHLNILLSHRKPFRPQHDSSV